MVIAGPILLDIAAKIVAGSSTCVEEADSAVVDTAFIAYYDIRGHFCFFVIYPVWNAVVGDKIND